MEVSKCTQQDGLAIAHLINIISIAKFPELTSKDIETIQSAKKWLHEVALQVAQQLRPQEAPAQSEAAPSPLQGIRIKSQGTLPSKPKSKSKKKK